MSNVHQPPTLPEPQNYPLRFWLFFGFAFGIAWIAWAPLLLHKLEQLVLPIPYPLALFVCQTLGAFAPLLALFILQNFFKDHSLIAKVFSQVRIRHTSIFWYVVPALTPILVTVIIGIVVNIVLGETIQILRPEPIKELGLALLVMIPFQFALGMIGSPLGEEPGWRGYVFSRFAHRGQALIGSLVVACLWWVWHIPLFIILDVPVQPFNFLAMAGHSLIIDSFFLLSGHNLFVAMLYHQGINTSFLFFISKAETPAGALALLVIGLTLRIAVKINHNWGKN